MLWLQKHIIYFCPLLIPIIPSCFSLPYKLLWQHMLKIMKTDTAASNIICTFFLQKITQKPKSAPVLLWCPCWWLTAPCGRLKRKTALLLSSNKELLHWCFTQSNLSHSMIEILLWPAEPLFVWNLKITNWRLFELSKLKFTLLKFL